VSDRIAYELIRFRTRDGGETTVYIVRQPLADTRVSVRLFAEPERLDVWCRAEGVAEALVAGFFVRDPYRPLGEVRLDARVVEHERSRRPTAPRSSTPTSRPSATRAARSASATTSCSRSAATGGARAPTPGSTSRSWRG
jgi:hypothetical protein